MCIHGRLNIEFIVPADRTRHNSRRGGSAAPKSRARLECGALGVVVISSATDRRRLGERAPSLEVGWVVGCAHTQSVGVLGSLVRLAH